jgi:hypothetical protein
MVSAVGHLLTESSVKSRESGAEGYAVTQESRNVREEGIVL